MSDLSDYAAFADRLRADRARVRRIIPVVLAPERQPAADETVVKAATLVDEVLASLGAAEEELRSQNEALFDARLQMEAETAALRELFEFAPYAYLVTNHDGLILRANQLACGLLGRRLNAFLGKPLSLYVAAEDRPVLRTGIMSCSASGGIVEWPLRLVPAQGLPIDCRVRVRASRDGARGVGLYWIITEERHAEDLL